jgi:hypothetical protein
LALPLPPAAEVASNEELEELVAIALTSAHEAEDVSWQANEASRKARRGMAVAVGLAVLGIAIAGTAAVSARLYGTDDQQIAQIAGQVQAMDDLQHHIDQQLAEIHAQGTVQEASAEQPPPTRSAGCGSSRHIAAAEDQRSERAARRAGGVTSATSGYQSAG